MSEKIWNYFYEKIGNPYGTAALMGNFYIESRLSPTSLQSSYSRKLGLTSEQYTRFVDNGTYANFINDSAGYGLAQWTYWSRKEALYNFAKSKRVSIGDLDMQLEFVWKELQSYKTCLKALKEATNIRNASDVIVERYEKPADQSEKSKQNRADFGQKYFDLYYSKKSFSKEEKLSKSVIVLKDRVNVRSGNGKEFARIFLANKGSSYEWVATSENGWHAVKLPKQIGWISSEFSKIQ